LVPLQDEALRVIGALVVVQGTVKKATQDNEEKLMTLTAQVVEEILEKEVEVKKEVTTTRETLQNFMEAWKGATQQA
jgi:molybdopterin synthase catalytic subunit